MARQGYFGEIIHGEGAYIHNLIDLNFKKDEYSEMWRLKEYQHRNGNLYPTHGAWPDLPSDEHQSWRSDGIPHFNVLQTIL